MKLVLVLLAITVTASAHGGYGNGGYGNGGYGNGGGYPAPAPGPQRPPIYPDPEDYEHYYSRERSECRCSKIRHANSPKTEVIAGTPLADAVFKRATIKNLKKDGCRAVISCPSDGKIYSMIQPGNKVGEHKSIAVGVNIQRVLKCKSGRWSAKDLKTNDKFSLKKVICAQLPVSTNVFEGTCTVPTK